MDRSTQQKYACVDRVHTKVYLECTQTHAQNAHKRVHYYYVVQVICCIKNEIMRRCSPHLCIFHACYYITLHTYLSVCAYNLNILHFHASTLNITNYLKEVNIGIVCCLPTMLNMFSLLVQTCKDCGTSLSSCPLCREPITTRLRLYT